MSCIQIIIWWPDFFFLFHFLSGPMNTISMALHCWVFFLFHFFSIIEWIAMQLLRFNSCLCAPTNFFFIKKMKWNKRNIFYDYIFFYCVVYKVFSLKERREKKITLRYSMWTNDRKGKSHQLYDETHTHSHSPYAIVAKPKIQTQTNDWTVLKHAHLTKERKWLRITYSKLRS